MAGSAVTQLGPNPAFTMSSRSTRSSGDSASGPARTPSRVEPDGGVVLMASSGELAEAEAVGAEVARLLDDGTPAGEIAIVLRQPDALGPLYRRVFDRFAIPVAVQADLDVTRTLTGNGR